MPDHTWVESSIVSIDSDITDKELTWISSRCGTFDLVNLKIVLNKQILDLLNKLDFPLFRIFI